MSAEAERWFVFVTMTILMMVGTIWHIRQQRAGAFKGFAWLGKLLVGRQVITDRRANPGRFRILKWLIGLSLVGIWIGWAFLVRTMTAGHQI